MGQRERRGRRRRKTDGVRRTRRRIEWEKQETKRRRSIRYPTGFVVLLDERMRWSDEESE